MLNFHWEEHLNTKVFYFPITLLAFVLNDPIPPIFPSRTGFFNNTSAGFSFTNFNLFLLLAQSNSGIFRFTPILKPDSKFISFLQLRLDLPEGTMAPSVSTSSSLF